MLQTRMIFLLSAVLCCGLFFAPAIAQEAAPLTLEECIAIAMDGQTDVLLGKNSLVAAKARKVQANSDYFPQISVQATETVLESGSSLDRSGSSLSIKQTFYDGGLRESKTKSAQLSAEQSEATLARTQQTVTYNVTRAYVALLRAQRLAGVSENRLKYIEAQRNLVKSRIEVGDAAEVDLLPVEAQYANARVDQLATKNSVRTASLQLQQAMGLPAKPDFAIQDLTAPVAEERPLDEYLALGLKQRPETIQAKAAIGMSKESVRSAKITLYPRPVVTGSFDLPFDGNKSSATSISAGISYDLFNGSRNRAAYREAQVGLESAELRSEQLERDIAAQVQEAYLNVENARERMDASALSLQAAQRNLEAQEERYKQGLAIPLDMLNAQLEVVTAESNAVQARYDYYNSFAQLEYAIGLQGGLYAK